MQVQLDAYMSPALAHLKTAIKDAGYGARRLLTTSQTLVVWDFSRRINIEGVDLATIRIIGDEVHLSAMPRSVRHIMLTLADPDLTKKVLEFLEWSSHISSER